MAKKTETAAAAPAATPAAAPPVPAALAQATALARTDPRANLPVAEAAVNYAIAGLGSMGGDLAEAMRENLGGAQLSAFDFERIKVPSGGGLAWQSIDADTGKPKIAEAMEGIVVAWNDQKAYWAQGLDEAGAAQGPPQCFSLDTIRGIGTPGIVCAACPHNVFGTAKGGKGAGKACKDWRAVFFVREGDILPILLPVPPTSIKAVKQYFIRLAARGIPYFRAVTRFRLAPAQNAQKIQYAQVVCELVGILPDSIFAGVKGYHEMIKKQLSKAHIQARPDDLDGRAVEVPGGFAGERMNGDTGEVIEGEVAGGGDNNVDRAASVI